MPKLDKQDQRIANIFAAKDVPDVTIETLARYTQRARRDYWHRFKGNALPSDFFHQNVFCSFQEDALGVRERYTIGVDNLLWGSDYPHQESTFPKSQEILAQILEGVPAEEQAKIVGGNATRLYHFA
jgi:predicted TIM-barrel fold metal-dependent hydrolase